MEWYEKCQTRLKKAPPGRLVIHRVKEKVYYYWRTSTGDKYLKPDDPLINLLAQKTYDQDVLRTIRQEMRGIQGKKCKITKRPEDCYYQLAQDRRALIEPIALNDEDFVRQWQSMRFPENPLYKKKGSSEATPELLCALSRNSLLLTVWSFNIDPFIMSLCWNWTVCNTSRIFWFSILAPGRNIIGSILAEWMIRSMQIAVCER